MSTKLKPVRTPQSILAIIVVAVFFHALLSEWLFSREEIESPELQASFSRAADEYNRLKSTILNTFE